MPSFELEVICVVSPPFFLALSGGHDHRQQTCYAENAIRLLLGRMWLLVDMVSTSLPFFSRLVAIRLGIKTNGRRARGGWAGRCFILDGTSLDALPTRTSFFPQGERTGLQAPPVPASPSSCRRPRSLSLSP